MVVVATAEEYEIAQDRFKGQNIIETGIGGLNVLQALKDLDKSQEIINFGFCGSNKLPVGTEVEIGECRFYHPNVDYPEPVYKLNGNTTCYTNNDFVLSTEITEPVVFDMELAYILALGFDKVTSIKVVSDNLSLEQYEEEKKCLKK